MKTIQLRQLFLNYFIERGHENVPSSPLVPGNDPTLLFTNSGMVQFKDVFTGQDSRSYSRAVTAQRCVRAGGKHNDLENVGYTARHHTFFEMLGNFSFGDYFKKQAIHYAWELLTREIGLDRDRLWVTVYKDDDEAADVWLNDIGVPTERFRRIATSDNFWAMGDTGPCGPCSEIFYDHGPEVEGGPPGSEDEDGDRYVELWNLVFMQFDRLSDGSKVLLPKPSVDTGMGLERIATVLQKVYSNYEIDLFQALIKNAATVVGTSDFDSKALRVIADHIRSAAFLITDGVTPSNETRGYVLRRIIRRAIRHGYQLGCRKPFFHQLTGSLVEQMGDAYPELRHAQSLVERILLREEQQFLTTLDAGLKILDREIASLSGSVLAGDVAFRLYDTYGFPLDLTEDYLREFDLTMDKVAFEECMAQQRERSRIGKSTDFTAMQIDGNSSNVVLGTTAKTEFTGYQRDSQQTIVKSIQFKNEFLDSIEEGQAGVLYLEVSPFYAESGGQVGDTGTIDSVSGRFRVEDTQYLNNEVIGHIGRMERGRISVGDSVTANVDADIRNSTRKNHSATHLLHAALKDVLGVHVQQKGSLVAPDRLRFDFSHDSPLSEDELLDIEAQVNQHIRENSPVSVQIMELDEAKAQGAAALFGEKYESQVRVISMGGEYSLELCGGTHVSRTGDIGYFKITQESNIGAGIRRLEALTGEKAIEKVQADYRLLAKVSRLFQSGVNDVLGKVEQVIEKNRKLKKELSELRTQLATGGVETKASAQRIQSAINGVARQASELPTQLATIGLETKASVHRIQSAINGVAKQASELRTQLATIGLETKASELRAQLATIGLEQKSSAVQIQSAISGVAKQASELRTQLATIGSASLTSSIETVGDVQLFVSRHDDIEVKDLRKIMARIQQKVPSGVVVLGSVKNGKATLMCSVSSDLLDRYHAGEIIQNLTPLVNGNGGGKPHMAQGGGPRGDNIDTALEAVPSLLV